MAVPGTPSKPDGRPPVVQDRPAHLRAGAGVAVDAFVTVDDPTSDDWTGPGKDRSIDGIGILCAREPEDGGGLQDLGRPGREQRPKGAGLGRDPPRGLPAGNTGARGAPAGLPSLGPPVRCWPRRSRRPRGFVGRCPCTTALPGGRPSDHFLLGSCPAGFRLSFGGGRRRLRRGCRWQRRLRRSSARLCVAGDWTRP